MDYSTKPGCNKATHSQKEDFAGVECLLLIHDEFEREGLRGLLANRGMKSIQSISHFESAVKTVSRLQPDVVIAVAGDPPECPVELLAPIRKIAPDSGIIVLCDPVSIGTYLPVVTLIGDFGPTGVKLLLRTTLRNGDRMATVVDQVLAGHDSMENDVVDILVQNAVKHSESLATKLTKRELRVLELAGNGAVNRTIAHQLNVSPAYVGNILSQIFTKLGLREHPDVNRRVTACREFFLEYGFGEIG